MYLKSVNGNVLYEGRFFSIRKGVEMAVREGVVLDGVDLRKANLIGAKLSRARMCNACLWGADLRDADLSLADIAQSDCRLTEWGNGTLAGSNCTACDFSGALFGSIVIKGANWERTLFTDERVFDLPIHHLASVRRAVFSYLGEHSQDLYAMYLEKRSHLNIAA